MIDDFFEENIVQRLAEMESRSDEIAQLMSQPESLGDRQLMQRLGREQRDLQEPLALYEQLKAVQRELEDVRELSDDGAEPELRDLAREDLERLETERDSLLRAAGELLRPRDPNDARNVIVEIRAAEG